MLKFALVVPNLRYNFREYLWSILPSRGLLSLAAVLQKEGFSVEYIDADIDNLSNEEVVERLLNSNCDVLGITMNTFQAKAGINLAKDMKKRKRDIKIMVGGPHPSALKKGILIDYPWIDIVCRGESEKTVVELAKCIRDGGDLSNIDGISYRMGANIYENPDRRLISDIDEVPFPAYALAGDLNRYPGAEPVARPPSMHIMASRGCPFHCIFCTKSVWGNTVRFRTPKNIVDEVEYLHDRFGINEIFFQDDTMNLNRKWFVSVCDEIITRGLSEQMAFKTSFRVDSRLLDEALLLKAKEAGFWIIFYGVESGNQKVLNTIKKGTTIEEIKRAFELTHRVGIETIAAFMVGNLGDTSETIEDSIRLAKEIKPTVFGFSIATPLPGTMFHEIARERGWIYSSDLSDYSQFYAVSRNEELSRKKITKLRNRADKEVRGFLEGEQRKSFPNHDHYCVQTSDFIKTHIENGERLMAPSLFGTKFCGKMLPFSASALIDPNCRWVVIHKGMLGTIDHGLLKHVTKTFRPVFANEVFAVFSTHTEMPEVDRDSPHIQFFDKELKLLRLKMLGKMLFKADTIRKRIVHLGSNIGRRIKRKIPLEF